MVEAGVQGDRDFVVFSDTNLRNELLQDSAAFIVVGGVVHIRPCKQLVADTELSELQAELPDKWEYYIDRLSGYIASTGRKYKNHAATIRRWVADDTAKAAPKRGIPDYSYKEGESL